MGVMTTKFLGKFGEIVFILRNAFIYRGLRRFLGDCYTLSPIFISRITGSVLLIIFRSLISLCFITCLIRISFNLKNDQKNRPHDSAAPRGSPTQNGFRRGCAAAVSADKNSRWVGKSKKIAPLM